MTYPGKNPNPTGANGQETPDNAYGAIKKATEQVRAAPLAGSASAINTPRRAQRASQRPTATAQPQPLPSHPVDSQPIAYQPQIAQVWAQLAAVPGASPLIQEMAAQAAQGGI